MPVNALVCTTRNSFIWRQSFNEYDDETLWMRMNACWKWIFNFIVFQSLLLLLTHIHSLDIYLSSSSNHQKNGWSAIIDSSQWTTGKRRLFYYNHRSFIHMQASNQPTNEMNRCVTNQYLPKYEYSLKLFFSSSRSTLINQLFLTVITNTFSFSHK